MTSVHVAAALWSPTLPNARGDFWLELRSRGSVQAEEAGALIWVLGVFNFCFIDSGRDVTHGRPRSDEGLGSKVTLTLA